MPALQELQQMIDARCQGLDEAVRLVRGYGKPFLWSRTGQRLREDGMLIPLKERMGKAPPPEREIAEEAIAQVRAEGVIFDENSPGDAPLPDAPSLLG